MNFMRVLPRFRKAYQALETLAAREHWSREEIEAFQLERLNALWEHAARHVPYYRQLGTALRLPQRFSSLEQFQHSVPVLPKSTVRANRSSFLSAARTRGRWVLTGGSTGIPTRVFWGHEAQREMLRARYRFYASWDLDIFDRVAFLWGHHASFAPGLAGLAARLRQPLEDLLRNRIRLSAYRLGRADLREHLRRISDSRPAAIYSFSKAAHLLAREAEATDFQCDSLKLIILTAEPAFPNIVEDVQRAFHAPVIVEYGSAECGFLAGQSRDAALRLREDISLIETLPRNDGRYDIVVTVLTNPSFPLIRYAIGDVTDAPLEPRRYGFSVLQSVVGRNNDFVLSKSGRHLHASLFAAIFENQPNIRRYQLYQHADGALTVSVERHNRDACLNEERLKRTLEHVLDGAEVTLRVVDKIPQTGAGKHRWIISELANCAECPREVDQIPCPV